MSDDNNRFTDGKIEKVEPNTVKKQYEDSDFEDEQDDESEDDE
jgi:hypothetical protein